MAKSTNCTKLKKTNVLCHEYSDTSFIYNSRLLYLPSCLINTSNIIFSNSAPDFLSKPAPHKSIFVFQNANSTFPIPQAKRLEVHR